MILPTQPLPEKGSGNSSASEMDVATEWHLGDVILDLYDVRDIFTSGGMGNVYRVHHRGWGIDLAVKSPKSEILKDIKNTDSFIHECETWVNLGLHPNIVSCYYVRNIQGIPRVFSEFVEGGSLSEWIRSGKLYQGGESEVIARILDIAIQVAWGINFAHSQGIIHQDIKPTNILMTPDGVGKITDFGLAKARQLIDTDQISNRSANILVSTGGYTPAYCSPEQAAHTKISEKTDTWSWAVTVLEMFVGEVLWVSGVVVDQALKDYSLKKEIPYKVLMPDELVTILSKCLQREVEIRPSLEIVAKDLINYYAIKIGTPYPRNPPQIIPGNPSTQSNLALSLLDLGRDDESEKIWDEVLHSTPHHLETLYNQGLFHWRSGRITDEVVVTQLEQAQHAQPGDQHGLLYLANIHLERGDISRALDNLRLIEANQFPETAHAIDYANANLDLERKMLKRYRSNISFISNIKLSQDGKYLLVSGGTDLLDNDSTS